jgi:hypothetical protein
LIDGVQALASQIPAARVAVLVNVGDAVHAQDDNQVTPAGKHKLDVDGRKKKVLRRIFEVFEAMIEALLERHETVYVYNVPGNHDPDLADVLSLLLEAQYRGEPRVKAMPSANPFQKFVWGQNLLGFAHWEGGPFERLPGIMATDWAEDWGRCRYRQWIVGHVHHKSKILASKEFTGCFVESVGTLAARDYWSHHKGFRSRRTVTCITYHKQDGEINRRTEGVERIRRRRGEKGTAA